MIDLPESLGFIGLAKGKRAVPKPTRCSGHRACWSEIKLLALSHIANAVEPVKAENWFCGTHGWFVSRVWPQNTWPTNSGGSEHLTGLPVFTPIQHSCSISQSENEFNNIIRYMSQSQNQD